jgi:hypothetical protein
MLLQTGGNPMKKLLIATAVAAMVGMTGCASNSSAPSSYAEYVAAAKAAHKASGDNIWKQKKMKKAYTDHYLSLAEAAKKKGDDAAALKYAKQAYHSASAQKAQTESWKTLKPLWEK